VGLSDIDRKLLERCLDRQPGAWEDFVDRFLGLVVHVIHHTAQSRSVRPAPADVDELAGEVFLTIIQDDFATLRHFRGDSSLATYLTVVARRVVVRELLKRRSLMSLDSVTPRDEQADHRSSVEERISNREQVTRLLDELDSAEAEVVRLYHLEGKSYREISSQTGVPENSIGPTLSRAREKMRRAGSVE
jgi:RNA polymerase sigma-70 factor, ECF subfamily